MNVLILCDKFLPISEQFIYNQIKCLDDHNLFLFSRKSTNRDLYHINFQNELIWYSKPLTRIRYKLQAKQNQFPENIQYLLRRFILVNDINLIYVHYGTTSTAYYKTLKNIGIPVICAFHGFDASRKLQNTDYRTSIISLGESVLKFTAPSQYLIDKLLAIGVAADQVIKIPYGAEINKIDRIKVGNSDIDDEKITIIHAGRIVAKKGVPDLVRVFLKIAKKYPNVYLKIVGGGEEEKAVREIAESSENGSKIAMTGPLNHDELIQNVKSADIFVLNSRETKDGETEGLPNSIMEAMACNTTVVSTRHSGIPELLKDQFSALLVDPNDNDQLEQSLITLIQSEELRTELARNARETVVKQFSLNQMKGLINNLVTSADI